MPRWTWVFWGNKLKKEKHSIVWRKLINFAPEMEKWNKSAFWDTDI